MRGLFEMFENPMTLGGIGLLSGAGWDGAMSGMRMGAGMQDRRREIADEDQRKAAFDRLVQSGGVPKDMAPILGAMSRDQAIDFLAKSRDPMRQLQMRQAEASLAQTNAETGMLPLRQQLLRSQIAQTNAQTEQGRNGKYGLQPIYGRDANGNPVIMQLGPGGQAVQTALPDGVSVDLGVKSFEAAAGRERGETTAKAQVSMPRAEFNARKMTELLDSITNDPYLPNMTGAVSGRLPNLSGAANRVQAKIDQVQGQTFLQAFEALKGAGQITEIEGQKATESLNRLTNTRQGTEDYTAALREFRQDVAELLEVARAKARGDYAGQPTPQAAPLSPSDNGAGGWSIRRLD